MNTVGWERGLGRDAVTQRNIKAAAREELVHYNVLTSIGGKAVTTRIWVPDAVFANRTNLLNTLQVGDQIFVNAYLIATKHFGDLGSGSTPRSPRSSWASRPCTARWHASRLASSATTGCS